MPWLALSQQPNEWVPTELDDGRYRVEMPGRPISVYTLNNANKMYMNADGTTVVGLSVIRYSQKGVDDAARDPLDYLRRHCEGFMSGWKGKASELKELADPDYVAVEHRFRHDGPLPPPGYMTHRAFCVYGQVCALYVSVGKEEYEASGETADAMVLRYFDSLVIDRKREPPRPFAHAAKDRTRWAVPTGHVVERFAKAHGMLADRFAFCQTMDFDEFHWVAEQLRPAGYRPISMRPYVAEQELKVAAFWIRDGTRWFISSGQRVGQVDGMQKRFGETLGPGDLAGWELDQQELYSVIWPLVIYEQGPHQMRAGDPASRLAQRHQKLTEAGYRPVRRQRYLGRGLFSGEPLMRQNTLFYKPRAGAIFRDIEGGRSVYEAELGTDLVPFDICLCPNEDGKVLYIASLSNAEKQFKESHGLEPVQHLGQCRKFASAGLLPVALSVTHIESQGYVTASIWHDKISEP